MHWIGSFIRYSAASALALAVAIVVPGAIGVPGVDELGIGTAHAQRKECPSARRSRYRVRIESEPNQAEVYVNDESCGMVGLTPWEGKLPKGDWLIILKKDGYEVSRRNIHVRRTRRQQSTFVQLIKKNVPGKLEVRADADKNAFNADVWVDGQAQGQVPVILELSAGRHLVEVKKEGFETFSRWVEVKDNERVSLNPTLKAIVVVRTGSIIIEADVPDAEVYLDGNLYKDTTPTVISGLTVGPHVVEVRKEPAMPWKQTINVEADKTVKVSAQLQATIGGPKGTLQIVVDPEGASVFLDGKEMGNAPITIKDVEPGEHLIEAKAKGYQPGEQRVTTNAGQTQVLKFSLNAEVEKQTGVVKVVSPVPEGEVFIDGARVGNVPQEKELPPGDHFVVVTKKGYKKFEQKVRVEVGQTITVTATLEAVGALRVLSDPPGGEVWIDGEQVGKTPYFTEDIDTGEHLIKVHVDGFYDFEDSLEIEGGEPTIINAKLELIPTGPTPEDLATEQRNLTTFGARVHAPGRVTLDFGSGYPYFIEGHFTVGAGTLGGKVGWDAGVFFRSFVSRTGGGFKTRFNLADQEPFSFSLFTQLGFGSNFLDESGRNSVFVDGGVLASLTGLSILTVTGRAYINFWSDRHCPPEGEVSVDQLGVCGDPMTLNPADQEKLSEILGDNPQLTEREVGVRLMTSVIVELAFRQRWSGWLMVEGAPFQGERAAFVDLFNPALIKDDVRTYFRLGATYKF